MSYDPFSNHPQANELLLEYEDFPKEYNEELRVQLIQIINDMCISINSKESSFYSDEETITTAKVLPTYREDLQGNQNIYYRTVRRKCVFTGQLLNNAIKRVPHGIVYPPNSVGWRIWGCASQIVDNKLIKFEPLPYASGDPTYNISLRSEENDVLIRTFRDRTELNFSFVVVEYAVPPYTNQ